MWDKVSWKMLRLVTVDMLGLFLNTLTGDDEYSHYNREKFPQQVQV